MFTKLVVVDASVLLKSCLRDEEAVQQVDELLNDFTVGRLVLAAPFLLKYEVNNALRTAVVRGRIDAENAHAALRLLLQAPLLYYESDELAEQALTLSLRYGRSAYDSTYLALAQQLGVWCFTGDRRLYNALGTQLPWLRWVGDYDWAAIPATSL
ncbi:tRNA(fMet)-specific endonuclease VapC [bacterium HR15]|uniref:Hypothetical conserved protein n=1 Tax=uncultured prokaryote TaxID=198431 RepID=H5S9J4_9ZZZZ|nr:hypothetical conserved protein [uncultured prokaryote]GBC91999.1 tRNA(fMet)-specific endonuclease VapC [bacterium HR15]